MPTYATKADCIAYIPGLSVNDDEEFDKLIERAERDIDSIIGFRASDTTTGKKFVPLNLTTNERNALRDATCAQVEYRLEMGERFFVRPQHNKVRGPEFETEGRLPRIGPKVITELEGGVLLSLSSSWNNVDGNPPWLSFSHNID